MQPREDRRGRGLTEEERKQRKRKSGKQNCEEFEVPDWAMPYAKAFLSLKYFPTIARAGV